jgi:hypothetical protein
MGLGVKVAEATGVKVGKAADSLPVQATKMASIASPRIDKIAFRIALAPHFMPFIIA